MKKIAILGSRKKKTDSEEDVNVDEATFCKSKNGLVNIIYVIDNTSSMSKNDVEQVRSAGSALLTDIRKIAEGKKGPKFQMAVVGFGNGSSPMPNGWVKMDADESIVKMTADLHQAADPNNRGGDSIPDVGLGDAKTLFQKIPTKIDNKSHRNFIVLYTDYGIEEEENERNLPVIAQDLASQSGAAILVVGLGNPDSKDQVIWEGVSLPKKGIVAANHVGIHVSTGSASELTHLFQSIGKVLLAECE